MRLIVTCQQRGRISADINPILLAEPIVSIATSQFGSFVGSSTRTVDEMLAQGAKHIRMIVGNLSHGNGADKVCS